MRQATITINGRVYDALNGTPLQQKPQQPTVNPALAKSTPQKNVSDIAKPAPKRNIQQHPAHTVHSKPQKAKTLNRIALQKPLASHANQASGVRANHSVHSTKRSPLISRFKPTVISPAQNKATEPKQVEPSIHANTTPLHPSVMAAMQSKQAQHRATAATPQSSKELKEMLIKERLAEVGNSEPAPKQSIFARKPRLASILVSSLSLLLLGGYFTYINLTNISMRVAASNAGINASFPGYKPDGFSLNGPITYAPGEVNISYKSNTNDTNFTLTQKASTWDSQGVLDNYVRKQTSTYLTFQQRGVTVYTFSNKAAWTNGGLLYTIEGDAGLSSDQILKLATSL